MHESLTGKLLVILKSNVMLESTSSSAVKTARSSFHKSAGLLFFRVFSSVNCRTD